MVIVKIESVSDGAASFHPRLRESDTMETNMTSERRDVPTKRLTLLGLVIFLSLVPLLGVAFAGQEQSATIIGQVKDESGGVLPGVTVTATSPALQVAELVNVTDANGEYRLAPLPIGTYQLVYSLQGFQTIKREDLRLTVGFVAKVDVELKVGSIDETITVVGAAPVVDVTSASSSTRFTKETLELIPSSRNGVIGLMNQAPGVRSNFDVGGNTTTTGPSVRAFGQPGEWWAMLDGVVTTALTAGGGNANYWDYLSIEEAEVQTVANDAEMPTRGVLLNTIVKSGSNNFHGGLSYAKMDDSLQSKNIDDALRAQGITTGNRLKDRWDVSGELGGKFLPDKLWYYVASRYRYSNDPLLNAFKPDGSVAESTDWAYYQTGKLSYQLSSHNRLVGFYQYLNKRAQGGGVTEFVPWEKRGDTTTWTHTGKVEWQTTIGNSVVTSVQYGNWGFWPGRFANNAPGKVSTQDIVTLYQSGPGLTAGTRPFTNRHDTKGSVSVYRPDLLLGNHAFKAGFEYIANSTGRPFPNGDPNQQPYNYHLIYRNGVPFQIRIFNHPNFPKQLERYSSVFAKDTWVIARRLTLDLGLRYAHDNGFVPGGCRDAANPPGDVPFPAACFEKTQLPIWNGVAPRLHAAYVLTSDNKTVVKGGWGKFDHIRTLEPELSNVDPLVDNSALYRWNAPIGTTLYAPGQVNLDPNGPDFVSKSTVPFIPNPDEQQPMTSEYSLSLEREVLPNFALRATGIYSRNWNIYRQLNPLRPPSAYNIAVTNPDPGPDGRVGTADDPGRTITYYQYPAALAGTKFEQGQYINDPNADQTFKSFEVAAYRRLSDRWQMAASYSATKKRVPFRNGLTETLGGSIVLAGPVNPNAEINQSEVGWEKTAKASGAYMFPADILASANFEYRSGLSWARQVLFTNPGTIPSITLNAEPMGTRQMPSTSILDLRVQKAFALRSGQRVLARINLYNALNVNAVTGLIMRSGATFLRPTAIVPPRVMELSASYEF